ncbi:MAG: hypothetical protein OCD76_21730 [Reichenbachiella sp.]
MNLPNKTKSNLIFIIINLAIVISVIGLSEIACNYYLSNPTSIPKSLNQAFKDYYRFHDRSIVQVTDCGTYDSGLFYTLAPGDCTFDNREFQTDIKANSQGIRDDEQSLNSPEIVVIGDSFSMGWGVQSDNMYPNIIEEKISKKVLNASISSYGTAREMILLERLKVNNPKYLIIQYHQTDYSENLEYKGNNNKLVISSEQTYDSLKTYISERQKYFPGKHVSQTLKYFLKSFSPSKNIRDPKSEAELFLNALQENNVRLDSTQIILFEAEHIASINNDFVNAVNELIESNDYPASIESMKIIRLEDQMKDEDFFILDNHFNATGHQKIANILVNQLIF